MTKEELLKPRYRVIADYPNSELPTGLMLTNIYLNLWSDFKGYEFREDEEWFAKYPHLFKKLEWWEERDVADMPK